MVQRDLDLRVTAAAGRAAIEADDTSDTGPDGKAAGDQLQTLASELDLDPHTLKETLEGAMAIRAGRPQLEWSEETRTCKLLNPSLTGWTEVIDDSLRLRTGVSARGPVPRLAFSPDPFLQEIGERLVFCPRKDVLPMHLSHPMLQRALSALTRRRFPGTGDTVSRWTVWEGGVPPGADALVLLSVEELAINDLCETFHHWVRTIAFPISNGSLGGALKHRPAMDLRPAPSGNGHQHHAHAPDLLDEVMPDLKRFLVEHAGNLTSSLKSQLISAGVQARTDEEERYRSRQGEVSALITENTLAKIEREIEKLKVERQQGLLFDGEARLDSIDRSIEEKQEEMARRRRHYEEVREQLERERERIVRYPLPKRHAMAGTAQVFPVGIEVRVRGEE